MSLTKIVLPLFVLFGLTACNGNKLIDEVKDNPAYGWVSDSLPSFQFEVEDTNYTYDLYLKLRVDGDYPFRNIWIRHHEKGPSGQESLVRKHYTLSTPEGKWTGSGIGGIYTYEFLLAKDRVYHGSGIYHSQIEQYMRVDTLPHIQSVGMKVVQSNQRFSLDNE
jgi:gliding motility-associated lipoprotein GldH